MAGLGDSLLTYPALEILSKRGYEITVWGNTEYFTLAKNAGFCERITFYEPEEKFDLAVIFSSCKEIFTPKADFSLYIKPIPKKKIWIVDYYLKELNLHNESFSKTLRINAQVDKSSNLCIVHPGSGSKKKNPKIEFFFILQSLLEDLGFDVLFLLGPAEEKLKKLFKNTVYLENLQEISKLLIQSSLYIGLDSGVSHLSSYIGVTSIVIFGPTDSHVWHPIGKNLYLIRNEKCPPCFPQVCEERECLNTNFLIEQIGDLLCSLCKNIKKLKISKA